MIDKRKTVVREKSTQQVSTDRIITIDSQINKSLLLKVCAYVRVSSSSEEQMNSYTSQLNTYSKIIRDNPKYEYVGIYADEGITGTDMTLRPEFNRMVLDCKRGKIDKIITKSISRFARNVPDLLETVRELSKIGVTIFFEKESIDTGIITNEMLLIVLSSIAESESVSTSQNQKMGIQARMQAGTYLQSNLAYAYEYNEQYQPVIIKSQADIVKRIFSEYLSGNGIEIIARNLNQDNIPSPQENKWTNMRIKYILQNTFYTGEVLWQKKCKTDTLPRKEFINKGEKPQYIVKNHHKGIISEKDFITVQDIEPFS